MSDLQSAMKPQEQIIYILGQLQGQQIVNRLNFTSDIDDPTVTTAFSLLQSLGWDVADVTTPSVNSVFENLLIAQTTAYQMDEILVRNLFNVTDFVTMPVTGAGWAGQITIASGDRIPTFVASKIQTNRVRTDIRRGSLALTGGTEEQIEGSDVWNTAYVGLLTDLCSALNLPPSRTVGASTVLWRPSVYSKERYEVNPGGDPVRYAYRYYLTEEEQAQHVAIGVTWSPVEDVTSQVSRKIGRGS